MKISINQKEITGPYGGGNRFVVSLKEYLKKCGHEVFTNLVPGLDVILLVSTPPYQSSTAYTYLDIEEYLLFNQKTIAIHRINICDATRGSHNLDKVYLRADKIVDFTVFISEWLKNVYIDKGWNKKKPCSVIYNGADTEIFNSLNKVEWRRGEKIKIVTHHWSNNYLKGHDVYMLLDQMLDRPEYASRFQFTYIGNVPKNIVYKKTNVLPPMDGKDLANELKKHNLYLTAAQYEPAGMHHIEAGCCGLPILYRMSGSLPEYCSDYGVGFMENNFEKKLMEITEKIDFFSAKTKKYRFTAERMIREYVELIENLVSKKKSFKKINGLEFFLKFFSIKSRKIYYFFIQIVNIFLNKTVRRLF